MALKPLPRFYKPGWREKHNSFVDNAKCTSSRILLIGDSIVSGLTRYSRVWSKYFEPLNALNFGSPGDCVENVLWRVQHGELPAILEIAVIHVGTNNVDKHNAKYIVSGIIKIASCILNEKPRSNIIITGLIPRDEKATSEIRIKINFINQLLQHECQDKRNVTFLEPEEDWVEDNGNLRRQFYYRDFLHLVERGNYKFASWIWNAIKHLQDTRDAFSNTIAAKTRSAYSDLTISDKTNTDLTEVIPGRHVTSNITDTTPDLTGTVSDKTVTTYLTAVTANLSGTAWDKTVTADMTETTSDIHAMVVLTLLILPLTVPLLLTLLILPLTDLLLLT